MQGVTSSPQGLQLPPVPLRYQQFPLFSVTARMLSPSCHTKHLTLATFSSYTCLDLILPGLFKGYLSVVFCPQLCVFWVASSCPSRASLSSCSTPCLESREAYLTHLLSKGLLACAFLMEARGGTIWRSKRMKKVRNQPPPLPPPCHTFSVDLAFLQKKQCSPPRRGEDCIHSLGLL